MLSILARLKRHKDEIGSACAIIGILVASAGFYLTISQVKATKEALQASNVYEIQRDARELISEVTTESIVRKAIRGEPLEDSENEKLRTHLWKLNNFYLSVFRQAKAGGISNDFASAFQRDFCDFITYPNIDRTWAEMGRTGLVGKAHNEMKAEWCK